MASVAAVSIEGVLAKQAGEDESFAISAPIQTGLKLLVGLSSMFKLVLLTDEEDMEVVDHFLKLNSINHHALLLGRHPWQVTYDHVELRDAQLAELRGQLTLPVSMLVDPDPRVAVMAMNKGVVGLVFAHPQYQRPEFRPDALQGVKAWGDIEAEITEQKVLREADPRLTPGLGV